MNIKFNSLEFRNILSFGNAPTKINFEHGLHLIIGKNGSGKSSSLLDTLSFCLFGVPYRKIKLEELLNRKTKRGLEVTCNFDINNTNYTICRGLKPNKLSIRENGLEINLLSSKRLNNDEIESKIGINFKMFKQIISLSINQSEPFLDTSTTKKREITDELFNIAVLTKIDKNIKDDTKNIKLQLNQNQNTIDLLSNTISNFKIRLSEAEHTLSVFDKNKALDINNINTELNEKIIQRDELKLKGKTLEQELKNYISGQEDDVLKQLDDTKKQQMTFELSIKQNQKNITFLNNNDICPTCNIEIDSSHKNMELEKLTTENKEFQKSLDDIKIEISKLLSELQDKRKQSNAKLLKEQEFQNTLTDYKRLQSDIKQLNLKLDDISNRTFNVNIENIKIELLEKENQIQLFKNDSKILTESMMLNIKLNEYMADDGFKSFIYEQLIPILNSNINEYLKLFELPVNISFTSSMDVNIKTLSDNTNGISYYSFSEGEKKRIDIAILLSFINVTKSLTNWNCNLLIIDELLDSSIDEDGLDKLLLSLEQIIKITSNMCVYIISHKIKKEYVNQFKSFIELEKNRSNFSEIKITNNTIGAIL